MSQPGQDGTQPLTPASGQGQRAATWPTSPPPMRPLASNDPAVVGRYRLESVIGEGGMGRVYLAHTAAGRAVAIKVVRADYAADESFRRRFAQEAETARRVQGLYTLPVVDADLEAEAPWLATPYVPGPSLQYAVAEHGPLSAEATLVLIAGVAEALESIHAAGVIHRDLKPSNVILTGEGPKVIDFGIARAADVTSVTRTGAWPGTPGYLAPEHIRGEAITPEADVFALGVLANFAATGRLAFGEGTDAGVIYRIMEQEPNLDGCPEPIRGIAAACLNKDPTRRPGPDGVIELCRHASGGNPLTALAAIPASWSSGGREQTMPAVGTSHVGTGTRVTPLPAPAAPADNFVTKRQAAIALSLVLGTFIAVAVLGLAISKFWPNLAAGFPFPGPTTSASAPSSAPPSSSAP
jgi:serine/threonine protein kinase